MRKKIWAPREQASKREREKAIKIKRGHKRHGRIERGANAGSECGERRNNHRPSSSSNNVYNLAHTAAQRRYRHLKDECCEMRGKRISHFFLNINTYILLVLWKFQLCQYVTL